MQTLFGKKAPYIKHSDINHPEPPFKTEDIYELSLLKNSLWPGTAPLPSSKFKKSTA